MSITVKIINKTAALQIILLTGGQQIPVPTTDTGVTNTFDLEREDDKAQAENLYKALTSPSVKRQREALNELVVEGFAELEAEFGPKKPAAPKPPAAPKEPAPKPPADKT